MELPHEPKEESKEPIAFNKTIFDIESGIAHEDAPNSPVPLLTGEGATRYSASVPPTTPTISVPEWGSPGNLASRSPR